MRVTRPVLYRQHRHLLGLAIATLLAIGGLARAATGAAANPRATFRFDADWQFYQGALDSAAAPAFADSGWRTVQLPHDWSIEDLPPLDPSDSPSTLPSASGPAAATPRIRVGPFDSAALGGVNTGFTIGGTAWYRKHFPAPAAWRGQSVRIQFDGVYMDADVWFNGHHLGRQPYGYTSFGFDLTAHLNFGDTDNVLAVEVKNEGHNSRWYSGSGIYRHVWLEVTGPVRVAPWGVAVAATPSGTGGATVRIDTTLANQSPQAVEAVLVTTLLAPDGRAVATLRSPTHLDPQTTATVAQTAEFAAARLWSPDTPVLYRAITELHLGEVPADRVETPFGIRSLRFDPAHGFFLNDRSLKLRGGCVHANNGPLGAAAFDRAEERRVELLKAAGFNAVRCAHNPPSPAFLDACDRLGLLVIDEAFDAWTVPHMSSVPDDYHRHFADWWERDLAAMIRRDRNHPSIILWSIGNQIPECAKESGAQNARRLADFARALDPTRPVTSNVFQRSKEWSDHDPFFAALDVAGYSYARAHYDEDHARLPGRVIFSSEIAPADCFENWMAVVDRDYICGNFEWTAFDYMGEVGLGWWSYGHNAEELVPWTVNYSGDLDICGFRRPRSYYRDVLWSDRPQVSVFVHGPTPSFAGPGKSRWGWDDVKPSWTWPGWEEMPLQVDVYSSCETVHLLLNGHDLGAQPTSRATRFRTSWSVPYAPGTLEAVGYVADREVARSVLRTAGPPAAIRFTPDHTTLRADGQDLSFVTVELVDARGERCPDAARLVHFAIAGAGTLAAVGSSRPDVFESFQQSQRTTYEGRCLAIVRSTARAGTITLTASAAGLGKTCLELHTHTPDQRAPEPPAKP